MRRELDQRSAVWVNCVERPFTLERNTIEVNTLQISYKTSVFVAVALIERGFICLVFYPVRRESEL
jgi:hypothetical protein